MLEKTLESALDCKEIQLVHPKGDQSWVFIGRTDVEAETPILWPSDAKSWLIWKDPDAGKDWGQKEKGTAEDEMVGWHHWLDGHGFGWTPTVGDGQGSLACWSPWSHKESDTTEWLNWTESWAAGTEIIHILLPTHMHSLPHQHYSPLERYICYNWWTYIDTSSSKVSTVYIRIHSRCYTFFECVWTEILHFLLHFQYILVFSYCICFILYIHNFIYSESSLSKLCGRSFLWRT